MVLGSDDLVIEATTWGDLLVRAARTWPDGAVSFPGDRAGYAELYEQALEVAGRLLALGVQRGDHVGLLAPPGVSFLAALGGIALAGAVGVPVSDRFKAAELRHVVTHSDMQVLLTIGPEHTHTDFVALLSEAIAGLGEQPPAPERLDLPAAPRLEHVLLMAGEARAGMTPLGDVPVVTDARVLAKRRLSVSVADPLWLLYTSGTSAMPKGCVTTHEAVSRQAQAFAACYFDLTADDAYWCPLPLFHNAGLMSVSVCLHTGATFSHPGHFDVDGAVRQLADDRCTHWIPAFDTILLPILDHPEFDAATTRLRMLVSAGSPEYLEMIQRRLPTMAVVSNYGSTEGAGSIVMGRADDPPELRLHTCGTTFPGMQLRIRDPETGKILGPGERGEIEFRGPQRFREYYRDPEYTAEVIDADGWFRTGDLGRLTSEGALRYEGRLKDMLKVGGENVAAAEVEALLLDHPAVQIVSVVAAPDARYSEVPAAYVQLARGQEVTEQALIDHCRGRISSYKVPRYVRFVDEWPMSGTKIKKYVLRQWIASELADRRITEAPKVTSS
jgi:fatty-acyl-CoA synthase